MSDSGADNSQDRRVAPRCAYSATAVVYVANEQLVCRAIDISTSGMLIIPPTRRERGSFLRVNLSLPSFDEVLDVDAIVVREAEVNGRYAWGVAFHDPDERVVQLLGAFVQWALERRVEPEERSVEPEERSVEPEERSVEPEEAEGTCSKGSETPSSLKAVSSPSSGTDAPADEFAPIDTYSGKLVPESTAPLPNWTKKDNDDLEDLFDSVLAELESRRGKS
ncbi:MAG: PilZ domain-containing protein [Deltaproteobacteria bacterium]|nr:PilZ domain-containing protein [Deltaproteobacteria bacterium]